MAMQKKGLVALKEFFGYRPGEGMVQFKAEVDALSPEEKAELCKLAEEALAKAEAA